MSAMLAASIDSTANWVQKLFDGQRKLNTTYLLSISFPGNP